MFKQGKKYIAEFMIEFEALAMKAETDDIHTIFLLKKNVRSNIIKIILEYPSIAALETLNIKIVNDELGFILFYYYYYFLFSFIDFILLFLIFRLR